MAGSAPKRKGNRVERLVLEQLRAAGLEARRVPLSGSVPDYPGDLEATLPGLGRVLIEVKGRKDFKTLESWLEGRDVLILKPDRKPPLVVVELGRLLEALHRAGEGA
ncbi:hypothetical protein Mterra_01712 [Calidithermus terrae]|uniref:VRR-NUC domain protein n=1 Tax=Calidithermus terrae TaxID=1408545 RepID=A0A399EP64_9DEIN|nr:hypothetical protein [Calidithermus terrae]RIH85386.1 hypothetical protein Mterra_01712 [Calidithermus terrae]